MESTIYYAGPGLKLPLVGLLAHSSRLNSSPNIKQAFLLAETANMFPTLFGVLVGGESLGGDDAAAAADDDDDDDDDDDYDSNDTRILRLGYLLGNPFARRLAAAWPGRYYNPFP